MVNDKRNNSNNEVSHAIVGGNYEPRKWNRLRFSVLYVGLFLVMGLIITRGFYLQIVQGDSYKNKAEQNRVTNVPITAQRGIIYDRNGVKLVNNVTSTDVVISPLNLPNEDHVGSLFDKLPHIIDVTPDDIRDAIVSVRIKGQSVPLAKSLTHEEVVELGSIINDLPGIEMVSSFVRDYQYPYSLSHITGYTSPVSEKELSENKDLLLTDYTGKTGIEKQYDDVLRGVHGAKYVEVDARQKPQKTVGEKVAVDGKDLELTVDSKLQKFVFSVLAERAAKKDDNKKKRSASTAIVMEAKSGEVLALVNYPAFDVNSFSQPGRKKEASVFLEDEITPLFNRAISGTYAPGSTIKPFLAAAALEEGVITPQSKVSSTGGIRSGEWFFPDWKAGGHGETDVYKAIAESVNTFFYIVMGGNEEYRGLGVEKAKKYLTSFSWGDKTGIDLPSEAVGLLPDPQWKREIKQEQWYIGDSYHFGIGQGDVLVTPLQVATATAAVANEGSGLRPFILKKVIDTEKKKETSLKTFKVSVKKESLKVVKEGMRQAVTSGSAVRLKNLPWAVAGKTGTAQAGGEDTHAWFTGFGPYHDPELVVTVILERGGKGDKDAVPVAEEIWHWLEENYQ